MPLSDAPAWTCSRSASAATSSGGPPTRRSPSQVLDAYVAAGGNFIDTANSYLVEHGRSETIIGRWMADRGNRDDLVVATKVGGGKGASATCAAETIEREARAVARAPADRPDRPLLRALRRRGCAARAHAARVRRARARRDGRRDRGLQLLARAPRRGARAPARAGAGGVHRAPAALQPRRARLRAHAAAGRRRVGLAVRPYYGLARGFLTGKYRPGGKAVESARAGRRGRYLERGGEAVLEASDEVAVARRSRSRRSRWRGCSRTRASRRRSRARARSSSSRRSSRRPTLELTPQRGRPAVGFGAGSVRP